MAASNDFGTDFDPDLLAHTELFSARLTPHRSLSRTGFVLVMVLISLISFGAGLAFWIMGAWPIVGFFGLDAAAIYWAFRIHFRNAKAVEEITVTPSEVRVRRISHRGHVVEWAFNPLWVRIDQEAHAEFGIERLFLVSRGRRVSIGRFLGADEKDSFVKALQSALQAARRGPDYNPVR